MKRCHNCGRKSEGDFCQWCGYPLESKPIGETGSKLNKVLLAIIITLVLVGAGTGVIFAISGGWAPVHHVSPTPHSTISPEQPVVEKVPAAPSNLVAKPASATSVTLEWIDNASNEDGFRLYRNDNFVETLRDNLTTYRDTGLKPATSYRYVVKAYNAVGESGGCSCTARTPNPPITVRLDRIGVYDNREPWTRGTDGEVYVGIIVTDGNTIVKKQFPREGHYKLAKNETVDTGTIIFSVDEVGDHMRIAAIGYEDDGGPGEALLYQALGAVGEAYISGGAATLLEMTDFSLGNLLAKLFGAEDDWLGSYEDSWDSNNNWGIGKYRDIACEDERGIQCLRLWFTIESP